MTSTTNVQHQQPIVWPTTYLTVRAWHAAADRAGVLAANTSANVKKFVDRAEAATSPASRNNAAAQLRAVSNQVRGDSSQEVGLRNALLALADVVAR